MTRQWDPEDQTFVSHNYNTGVRRSANREHDYEQFKANFYIPTKRTYGDQNITFDFKSGRYSDGTWPRGVYNNSRSISV